MLRKLLVRKIFVGVEVRGEGEADFETIIFNYSLAKRQGLPEVEFPRERAFHADRFEQGLFVFPAQLHPALFEPFGKMGLVAQEGAVGGERDAGRFADFLGRLSAELGIAESRHREDPHRGCRRKTHDRNAVNDFLL